MAGTKRFAFNVVMNWIAVAVGMVVPFFLTPYVIKMLGVTAYGVWILAVSTVAYLNILDMGLRSAIVRFVSKASAEDKPEDATAAVGAALWVRVLISAGIAVLSIILAFAFPHLFKIPHDLQRPAQITVLMCALGVAFTLVSGVFGAVLSATHRFDVLSGISAMQTLARAGGVILILRSGHGLVPLAYWEMIIALLGGIATVVAALKLYPPSRVRIARPDMDLLKTIGTYSFTTFVILVAVQIVMNTDNLVVGAFVSVAMVAFYSIGGSLMVQHYVETLGENHTRIGITSYTKRFEDQMAELMGGRDGGGIETGEGVAQSLLAAAEFLGGAVEQVGDQLIVTDR